MSRLDRELLFALATDASLERFVRAVPALEDLALSAARQYVAGTTLADAQAVARTLAAQGLAVSVDLFGERVRVPGEAVVVRERYRRLADALEGFPDGTWVSLDLSHVGLHVDREFCARQMRAVAEALPDGCRLQLGAEEARWTGDVLDLGVAAARDGLPVMVTLQANLRRSPADALRLAEAGVPVRLVKGAYVEASGEAHPWGEATDLAFLALARQLRDAGADVAIATHDRVLREALLALYDDLPVEMLYGVRHADAVALAARGVPVRVYLPYGPDWFRYWMRRVAESRGA